MNVCQNTCALGRLVPLRNSADDPRCIVAPFFSGSADSPFPSSSLCSSSNLLILHSSLYSTFLSLLFFCFSSTLPIFVSTLLCSSHLHSPLPFPLFSTLDSTLLFIALLVFCSFSPHLSMPQSSANHLGGFEMHLIESYRFRCATMNAKHDL